ncbi:hypothetical protein [Flammeovirga sp. SJP92]|uniref:hypothetical protein n=1 Tax=Flammeovirga sp. SJP92 TaxID=1775430 RepID=UPI000787459A|nr:hypothetical protein [Flammeovirga sp. SJP92]KXX71708.1 hypothetical protein AVL50_05395 [Flammeovirga sp. SJP92]
MQKLVSFLLGLSLIIWISSCQERTLNDAIPKTTTFELSHGSSITMQQGNFTDTIRVEIYVPGKIASLLVQTEVLNIDLAKETKSHYEEQLHYSLLNGKQYWNVRGNTEATVFLMKEVLNDLEIGEHKFVFSVTDERNDIRNQEVVVTVLKKK